MFNVKIFIHRKYGSNTKHSSVSINTNKAKTATRSTTVVDTLYWSINKVSYITSLFTKPNHVLQLVTKLAKNIHYGNVS